MAAERIRQDVTAEKIVVFETKEKQTIKGGWAVDCDILSAVHGDPG
jgi:hypothetical protein